RMGRRRLLRLTVSVDPWRPRLRHGLPEEPWVAEGLEPIAEAVAAILVLSLRRLPKRRTGEDQHTAHHSRGHHPTPPAREHWYQSLRRCPIWAYAKSSLTLESMMNSVNTKLQMGDTRPAFR